MHIDERLEAVLLAAVEQPVNRAFLINFAMVGVEAVQEVVPYNLTRRTFAAQSVGDEF